MLSISRTQLSNQIIYDIQGLLDSIQSVLLFIIFLAQFNYFFSNNLNLIIQSMTIWKIRSPNIFQVFREGKIVKCHMFDLTIYCHTISRFHHFTMYYSFRHLIISPLHHCTIAPLYHCTIAPLHHCTIAPFHHHIITPSHYCIYIIIF